MNDRQPGMTTRRSTFGWVALALVCLLLAMFAMQNIFVVITVMRAGMTFDVMKVVVFFAILRLLVALATIALLTMRNDRAANYLGIAAILFCYPAGLLMERGIEAWFYAMPFHFTPTDSNVLAVAAACIYLLVSKDRAGVDLDAKVDHALKFIRS